MVLSRDGEHVDRVDHTSNVFRATGPSDSVGKLELDRPEPASCQIVPKLPRKDFRLSLEGAFR